MKKIIPILFVFLNSSVSYSLNANFIPKGVRVLNYRAINGKSNSQFNNAGEVENYGIKTKLHVNDIVSAFPNFNKLLDRIKKIDPAIVENLNLGEINIQAGSSFLAHVYSVAYGVNSKWMIGATVPYITGETKINGGFKSSNQLKIAANQLQNYSNNSNNKYSDEAAALAGLLNAIPSIQQEHLYNYLVTDLNYKPLGRWRGSDIGDINLFSRHNIKETKQSINAIEVGVSLNTGRKDDPDNLMDFAFGNEATGVYISNLFDYKIKNLILGYKLKLTGFLDDIKNIRANENTESFLSSQATKYSFKRGLAGEIRVNTEYKINEAFSLELEHESLISLKDKYSLLGRSISYLSEATDILTNSVRLGFNYNTIDAYKKSQQGIPYFISLFFKSGYYGKNSPLTNRAYLDFVLLF